jgi:hypothetical protein
LLECEQGAILVACLLFLERKLPGIFFLTLDDLESFRKFFALGYTIFDNLHFIQSDFCLCELVDLFFQIAIIVVPLEYDLAVLVDEGHVGNLTEVPLLPKFFVVLALPVYFRLVPAPHCCAFIHGFRVLGLGLRNGNDANILPRIVARVLCQHLLVARHGFITGMAPSGPEMDKPNLAVDVFQLVDCAVVAALDHVSDHELVV